MKILWIVFMLLTLGTLGCSSTESKIYRETNLPRTIAILPFQGEVDQAEKLNFIRQLFSHYLINNGFEQLRLDVVDQILEQQKLSPNSDLKTLGQALQVEGIIRGEMHSISNVNAAYLGYRSNIEGRITLHDVSKGDLIWEAVRDEYDYGGVIIHSGQVVEGISTQIDNSRDIGFVRLTEKFCQQVVSSAPKQTLLSETPPPQITQIAVKTSSSDSTLKIGDTLAIECSGNPGMQAVFMLEGQKFKLTIPMGEVESGHYHGSFQIQRGLQNSEISLLIKLTDPFDRQGRKKYEERTFQIQASPPEPPTKLTFQNNTFQWQGTATEYLVYGSESEVVIPKKLGKTAQTSINISGPYKVLLVCAIDSEGNLSNASSLVLQDQKL
ncbi:MAG: hypothetical protein AABZ60_05620 [Planctomycetota bacterium]